MKDEGIIAGLPVAEAVFRYSGQQLCTSAHLLKTARSVERGDVIARVHGRTRSILTGERLALNLLQRL